MKYGSAILIVIISSCGQNKIKQQQVRMPDTVRTVAAIPETTRIKVDTIALVKDSIVKAADYSDALNTWIKENFKMNLPITPAFVKQSHLDVARYDSPPTASIHSQQYEEYLRPTEMPPSLSFTDGVISADISDEDNILLRYFFTSTKVIRTYHLTAGSNGGSSVYDLAKNTNTDYPFTFYNITGNIASISRDGYDSEGHFWQEGELDLSTGKITWGAIEH